MSRRVAFFATALAMVLTTVVVASAATPARATGATPGGVGLWALRNGDLNATTP